MAEDLINGAGLLKEEMESVRDGKIKLTSRLQAKAWIYVLDSIVQNRFEINKLKQDNWVGVIKSYPRLSLSIFATWHLILISDSRHLFINWFAALIASIISLL